MSGEDTHHNIPKHPIAPRVKNGPKTPHIDHHDSYKCVRSARAPVRLLRSRPPQEIPFRLARARERQVVGPGASLACSSRRPRPFIPRIRQIARETLHWDRPFHTVRSGSFENGDIVWFPEGGLNASYNCVDRWAFKHPDKVNVSPRPRRSARSRATLRRRPRAARVWGRNAFSDAHMCS